MNTEEIKKKLKNELKPSRYEHTIGVAYTAMALAMRYGISLHDAEIAGLLHDCAKCMSDEKLIKICHGSHVALTETELNNPSLIHAKAGAVVAAKDYGIEDEGILDAIRYHTTGRPDMTMLEKIIFTADYIEPGRTKQKRLGEIRKTAFTDIDACIYMISADTLEYLKNNNCIVDELTESIYNFYKESYDIYDKWRETNEYFKKYS